MICKTVLTLLLSTVCFGALAQRVPTTSNEIGQTATQKGWYVGATYDLDIVELDFTDKLFFMSR